jgi:hypothetical protein
MKKGLKSTISAYVISAAAKVPPLLATFGLSMRIRRKAEKEKEIYT